MWFIFISFEYMKHIFLISKTVFESHDPSDGFITTSEVVFSNLKKAYDYLRQYPQRQAVMSSYGLVAGVIRDKAQYSYHFSYIGFLTIRKFEVQ
jgi:hypothetical protein